MWLSDRGGNKIENNLMTATFVLEIQGVYINVQTTRYLVCEVKFFLPWFGVKFIKNFPMIHMTAGANLAVKIQVVYFGVEMCLNH